MEFRSNDENPLYSGGSGYVAGDQIKAASDLSGLFLGFGLLYPQGIFRPEIDLNGEQHELWTGQLPISPLRKTDGELLRLKINLTGSNVWLRVWQAKVGKLELYILDSNDEANIPAYRGKISELNGGANMQRFKQQLILGIGWWLLLQELDIHPEVSHINEGHAAFAILELACSMMKGTG